jgi:hypothetical protein
VVWLCSDAIRRIEATRFPKLLPVTCPPANQRTRGLESRVDFRQKPTRRSRLDEGRAGRVRTRQLTELDSSARLKRTHEQDSAHEPGGRAYQLLCDSYAE